MPFDILFWYFMIGWRNSISLYSHVRLREAFKESKQTEMGIISWKKADSLPVALSQWEEKAELLVKFAELFVWAKQVCGIRLVGPFYFQNIYIILLWIITLLVAIHTNTQYTPFLLQSENKVSLLCMTIYLYSF